MADQVSATLPPNESGAVRILVATWIVTIAAVITTACRMWARVTIARSVHWDDYAMLFATLLAFVTQILAVIMVQHGGGKHMMYIPPADIPIALKYNFITQPMLVIAITTAKFSIGLFLYKMAVKKVYRHVIIWTIVFMWTYTAFAFFTLVLQCHDLRALWNPMIKTTCIAPYIMKSFAYINSSLGIFTDLMFSVFIPIPMLWNVQIDWRNKSRLIAVLSISLGLLATSASIIKLTYVTTFGKQGDWLWDTQNLAIWTAVECGVGIVAGNLPALRQLFKTVVKTYTLNGSANRSGRGTNLSGSNSKVSNNHSQHGVVEYTETKRNSKRVSKLPSDSDTELIIIQGTNEIDSKEAGSYGKGLKVNSAEVESQFSSSDKSEKLEVAGANNYPLRISKTVTSSVSFSRPL